MNEKLFALIKKFGEKDGNIYRLWLDGLNGVCDIDGHTDVMCAHIGEDGILTYQVNTPNDDSTIFVYLEELPADAIKAVVEKIIDIACPENEDEEIYKDINGLKLEEGQLVHWHDEAGYDEDGSMIIFTIVEDNGDGYFNLAYGDEDENPERWAYYTELEIV